MTTAQDCSIGFELEDEYKVAETPIRWLQFFDETLDWNKGIKQGRGLRVGSRVARSARRTVPTADGGGDIPIELCSKGLGKWFQFLCGTAASALVSGSTYQQLFTLGDVLPSATIQKGVPRHDGSGIDPYTFLGAVARSFELDFPNGDIATLKATIDAGDIDTAAALTAVGYPSEPVQLFEFKGGSIYSGTLTVPTGTALASATTELASVRSLKLMVDHQINSGRFNFGGAGRKDKPNVGERKITGEMVVEYSSTTFRDAVLNDTGMSLLLTCETGRALSTGVETFQLALPELKFDGELPKSDGGPILVSMKFEVLDGLVAAQPLYMALRTSDTAL